MRESSRGGRRRAGRHGADWVSVSDIMHTAPIPAVAPDADGPLDAPQHPAAEVGPSRSAAGTAAMRVVALIRRIPLPVVAVAAFIIVLLGGVTLMATGTDGPAQPGPTNTAERPVDVVAGQKSVSAPGSTTAGRTVATNTTGAPNSTGAPNGVGAPPATTTAHSATAPGTGHSRTGSHSSSAPRTTQSSHSASSSSSRPQPPPSTKDTPSPTPTAPSSSPCLLPLGGICLLGRS